MRMRRVGGNEDMPAGNQHAKRAACEFEKEIFQFGTLDFSQDGEAWERAALATVERGRNAPDTAVAVAQLGFLFRRILLKTIRRVGDDGVDGILLPLLHPSQAIVQIETVTRHFPAPPACLRGQVYSECYHGLCVSR